MSDAKKSTSPSVIDRLKIWFKGIMAEYKLIVWPKKDELISMTIAVLVTCFIFGVLILGMDTVFNFLYRAFLKLIA